MQALGKDATLLKLFDASTGSIGKSCIRNATMLGVFAMPSNMAAGILIVAIDHSCCEQEEIGT